MLKTDRIDTQNNQNHSYIESFNSIEFHDVRKLVQIFEEIIIPGVWSLCSIACKKFDARSVNSHRLVREKREKRSAYQFHRLAEIRVTMTIRLNDIGSECKLASSLLHGAFKIISMPIQRRFFSSFELIFVLKQFSWFQHVIVIFPISSIARSFLDCFHALWRDRRFRVRDGERW